MFGVAFLAWDQLSGVLRWVGVVLGPVAVAVVWGTFLSPKAAVAISSGARLMLEALLFLGVGAGLVASGYVLPAVAGVLIWALDRAALGLIQRT